MEKQILTKKEFEIMTTIWQMSSSFTYHDILAQNGNINRNTLMAVLSKLLKMGFLSVDGFSYHDNCLTRTYASSCSQSDYFLQFMDEKSRNLMFKALLAGSDKEQLEKMKTEILEQLKELAIREITQSGS